MIISHYVIDKTEVIENNLRSNNFNNSGGSGSPVVKIITIEADYQGQRIDNFLLNLLKGVPKSRIYRILRKGEVRINKGRIKPSYRLKTGDFLRIPPVVVSDQKDSPINPGKSLRDKIEKNILYEDKYLIIINKPSGIAVHGGSGISLGMIEIIRALRATDKHLELAHRLDKDTSGCLIITKKRSILRQIHEHFRNNQMEKRYITLVKGKWSGGKRLVSMRLLKNVQKSGERIVTVHPDGKIAKSVFKPIKIMDNASLMEVTLITGRTHQIRVHAAATGHPIAGDVKYGDEEFNKIMRIIGLKRLFLHASSLKFELSVYDHHIHMDAPCDNGLRKVLDKLTEI